MKKASNFSLEFFFTLVAIMVFFVTGFFFLRNGFLNSLNQDQFVSNSWISATGGVIDGIDSFECGESAVYDADGNEYTTVYVPASDQCWMGENLNVGTFVQSVNRTDEQFAHSDVSDNGVIEKYCYDNSERNCRKYGGLYDWDEAMGYIVTEGVQGICPDGWHIPTNAEWHALESAFAEGGCDDVNTDPAYTELREVNGCGPAGTALGEDGVSGLDLPYRGMRVYTGMFGGESRRRTTLEVSTIENFGAYWTSSVIGNGPITYGDIRPALQERGEDYDPYIYWRTGPIYRMFTNEDPFVSVRIDSRPNGFFVRCIMDRSSEQEEGDEDIVCGVSDPLSCENDSDCICAGDGSQYHGCFSGNRSYYEKCEDKAVDCADYCQGWGRPNIHCVEGRCSPFDS